MADLKNALRNRLPFDSSENFCPDQEREENTVVYMPGC